MDNEQIKEATQRYLQSHGYEAMHLKAVLFDMDGVLYDSMPLHVKAWTMITPLYGLSMTPEEVYMNEGRTGGGTIEYLFERELHKHATKEDMEKIYEKKCEVFNTFPTAPEMPGAASLLKKVKEDGITRVLVTGSGQHSLLNRLEHSFPGAFDAQHAVTSFDVTHGKPAPEPYLKGLMKAGAQPWEAIVVENAPLGVRAAVAANVFTIAVNTGTLPDKALLDEGANLLFHSLKELDENWENIYQVLR